MANTCEVSSPPPPKRSIFRRFLGSTIINFIVSSISSISAFLAHFFQKSGSSMEMSVALSLVEKVAFEKVEPFSSAWVMVVARRDKISWKIIIGHINLIQNTFHYHSLLPKVFQNHQKK